MLHSIHPVNDARLHFLAMEFGSFSAHSIKVAEGGCTPVELPVPTTCFYMCGNDRCEDDPVELPGSARMHKRLNSLRDFLNM